MCGRVWPTWHAPAGVQPCDGGGQLWGVGVQKLASHGPADRPATYDPADRPDTHASAGCPQQNKPATESTNIIILLKCVSEPDISVTVLSV